MCSLNHPNAPSATDIAEPCFSDYATSTTHVSIDTNDTIPEDKSVNIVFGSIDHSFVESNVPIHESTNPLVLKPLIQSISRRFKDNQYYLYYNQYYPLVLKRFTRLCS